MQQLLGNLTNGPLNGDEIMLLLNGAAQCLVLGAINAAQIIQVVSAAVQYLANNPNDVNIFDELVEFLSPEVSGQRGSAAILMVVSEFAQRPKKIVPSRPPLPAALEPEEFEKVLVSAEPAFNWLVANQVRLGQDVLPDELVIASSSELVSTLSYQLKSEMLNVWNESKVQEFMLMLALAVCLAPHTRNPDSDLDLIRYTAAKLALGGFVQLARDLVSSILTMAGNNVERKRKAWVCAADTHTRLRDLTVAMVSLACAFSVDSGTTLEDAMLEHLIFLRILRDAGLVEFGRLELERAKRLLEENHALERGHGRLDVIELTFDLFEAMKDGLLKEEKIGELLDRGLKLFKIALELNDDILPVASLVAQVVRWCEIKGVFLDRRVEEFHEELKEFGIEETAALRLSTASTVCLEDLLNLLASTERTRNSGHRVADSGLAVYIAKHLLCTEPLKDDKRAAILLEVMTERAMFVPNQASGKSFEFNTVPNILSDLSKQDLDLMLLGMDADSKLVRVTASEGTLVELNREEEETFSKNKLREWKTRYPYNYREANHDDPNGSFYESTQGIGISGEISRQTLLIMETSLQRIPPNLLRLGGNLAGMVCPMASAPSLEWLVSDLDRQKLEKRAGALAWLLDTQHDRDALKILSAGVREPLSDFKIELVISKEAPYFENLDLAIIGGHGNIDKVAKHFRQFTNGSGFSVGPSELARQVRNINVLILFVCSGGVVDNQMFGHGTFSLSKQFLDNGVSAVLASPWPMEAADAGEWLQTFLKEMTNRKRAIEANYTANMRIASRTSSEARRCLAMNLYGNPFTKCLNLS